MRKTDLEFFTDLEFVNVLTPASARKYLETANVEAVARAIGMSAKGLYKIRWGQSNPGFEALYMLSLHASNNRYSLNPVEITIVEITIDGYRNQFRDKVFNAVVVQVLALGMKPQAAIAIGKYVADDLLVDAIRFRRLANLTVSWKSDPDTGAATDICGSMWDIRVATYKPGEKRFPHSDMPDPRLSEDVLKLDVSEILQGVNLLWELRSYLQY